MRPGINQTTLTSPPADTPPVNTGTWFVAGITSQGPTGALLVTSFQQFQQKYGNRGVIPTTWDALDTFFKQGGSQAYIARVAGPAASAANVLLNDSGGNPSLQVYATGPGSYANGYQLVVAGTAGSYTIQVLDASGSVLETSATLTSNADAVGYGQTSQQLIIVSKGANSPVPGTFTLAGGADDIANVQTAQYTSALATFTADLGPGQVSIPGVTTTSALTSLFNHCAAFNRIAVGDLPDVNTTTQSSAAAAASLTAVASAIRALGTTARAGGLFTPWADVAPLPGSIALRPVPPSAFAAARMAVVDSLGNPNVPAAGLMGALSGVVQLHAVFADVDRQTLNTAGVNVIRKLANGYRIYGNVTPVDRNLDPEYWQLNNNRLDMAILALAAVIQENYMFSQLDGQGLDAARYGGDLTDMLGKFYIMGALYGSSARDAFTVDTSPDVNTPASESLGNLVATIACRRSRGAEQVNLNVVRVDITQTV